MHHLGDLVRPSRRVTSVPFRRGIRPAPPLLPLTTRPAEAIWDEAPTYTLGFWLFILLNAILFVRPGEIWISLEGLPLYNWVMIACLIASLSAVGRQLTVTSLRSHPVTFCVMAMLPAVVLSQLVRGVVWLAQEGATEMSKILLYFLLLNGLVNTPRRLVQFLIAIMAFIGVTAVLGILSFHNVIKVGSVNVLPRFVGYDPTTGEEMYVPQLYGPGIFNDPNDLALILTVAILILLHFVVSTKSRVGRLGWLVTAAVPGYAFALTNSRGGFLSLAAGVGVLAISRFGWRRSFPVLVIVFPLLIALCGGRMTSISTGKDDTVYGRVMIWRQGFTYFLRSPIFGIGYMNFADWVDHVAHNSFVHAYTELGMIGGTIFLNMFLVPVMVLSWRRGLDGQKTTHGVLERWRPGLLAVMASQTVGMYSLSRNYVLSTYLVVGIAGSYCSLLCRQQADQVPSVTPKFIGRMIINGVYGIVFLYVVMRTF